MKFLIFLNKKNFYCAANRPLTELKVIKYVIEEYDFSNVYEVLGTKCRNCDLYYVKKIDFSYQS